MKAKWSILAVYENPGARDVAVKFCDTLVKRFWQESSLDLSWCAWVELENMQTIRCIGQKLRDADVVIVACGSDETMPSHVTSWLERALKNREEREGVLVGLQMPETGTGPQGAATQVYLRKLAHEAGMDYLDSVPQNFPPEEPDSVEAFQQRATQITGVLDRILQYVPAPPRVL